MTFSLLQCFDRTMLCCYVIICFLIQDFTLADYLFYCKYFRVSFHLASGLLFLQNGVNIFFAYYHY